MNQYYYVILKQKSLNTKNSIPRLIFQDSNE